MVRALSIAFLVLLTVSGIQPHDRLTWVLEVAPAVIGFAILLATRRAFPVTDMLYIGLFIHAVILMIGAKYTYAEVPFFNWLRDEFHLARNYYDRLGHLAQGFFPALAAREVLLRTTALRRGKMLFFLVVCVCLAFSALYELIEWWAALILGQGAEQFLGTQGDIWDTQSDMFMALLGAITAQLTLSHLHDRQMKRL